MLTSGLLKNTSNGNMDCVVLVLELHTINCVRGLNNYSCEQAVFLGFSGFEPMSETSWVNNLNKIKD